jgi:hypothetical protein
MVDESISHHIVKFLAGVRAMCSPPEPFTTGFVEWSPKNRDTGVLEFLKLVSNCI